MQMRILGLIGLLVWGTAVAAAETRLTWHGHATFSITTPTGKVVLIDPWLKGNPKNPNKGDKALDEFKRVDYILLTHAHGDHVGDAAELGRKTGAKLVTNFDLGKQMVRLYGYPEAQAGIMTMMNIGGEIALDEELRVAMTNARHSSGLGNPEKGEGAPAVLYGGDPAGLVVKIANGPTIYHSGDTDYFGDMEEIGRRHRPDVALLSVGDRFTMGMEVGVRAAQAVGAGVSIPQHFGTFPILAQDPAPFMTGLKQAGLAGRLLAPGETLRFEGRQPK